jgi:hypothetical protein
VALVICAAAVMAGVLWLLAASRDPAPAPATPSIAREPTTPSATTPPTMPPTMPQPTAPATPADRKQPKISIPRSSVQRDDGSGSGAFTQATLHALRDAAAPAVRRCIDDSLARYPELREQRDVKAFVNVVFTARATGGQVSVPKAHVVVNGFPDDELVRCAETHYTKLRIVAGSDQRDGEGTVQSGYEVK